MKFRTRFALPVLAAALSLIASCASTSNSSSDSFAKPGFHTEVVEGRLWIFREGTTSLTEFEEVGEPAKSVTLIGAGPDGMTLRGPDKDTIQSYVYTKPGYYVQIVEGRMWVFEEGSESLQEFLTTGEPAKSVTLIGVGPEGMTMRSSDKDVIRGYLDA